MPAGLELLSTRKMGAVLEALRDIREIPQNLRFLRRTPIVPAMDGEILAFVTSNVHIAAVVPDDAAAPVYGGDKIKQEITHLPNIKRGHLFTQELIQLLNRMGQGLATDDEVGYFTDYRNRTIDSLLTACEQQMEKMVIGAALDSYSYDRHGTTFTATFGTPADLKTTAGTVWSDSANATPVADIQTQQSTAREKYGVDYNRVTMTSATFREMIATTEFRNKATVYSQLVLPSASNFPTADIPMQTTIAGRMINATIELYDQQYVTEGSDGAETWTQFLPDGKVLLGSTSNDNNANAVDFGNAVVTESLVGQLSGQAGGVVGQFNGAQRGPVTYATVPGDLNAPNVTMWGVARGFPRRKLKSAYAVLTV